MKNYKGFLKKYRSRILLVLILTIAAVFRFEEIFTNSFPFTYDIGRDLLAAKDIANFVKLPLIGQTTGLPGLFYGPSWHYILGLLYVPLRGDPALFTSFIALTGILTVFLAFIFGKMIGGNFMALVFSSLLAVSSVVISLTSQVWNPDLIPILWIIAFFIINRIYRKKNIYAFSFLLGFVLSLMIDMEIVVGILFSVGVIISFILVSRNFLKIKNILFFLLGFLLVLSPRIVFDFRHQHILSKTLIDGINKMFINGGGGNIFTPVPHKLSIIFDLWNETIALKNPILGSVILIFVLCSIVFFLKRQSAKAVIFAKIVSIIIFITIFGVLFFGHDIWPHYLVILPLSFIFITSIALYFFYAARKYRSIGIILAVVLLVININPIQRYKEYTTPLFEGDAAVYRNQTNAVDYVYRKARGESFKYIVYTPPVYDYTYQYLFEWYGQKKYSYIPTDKNPKYLFVIMEPDFEYPQRLTDWLKLRKNDGKIIKEEKQKGGIVIQTRLLN